MGHLFPPFVFLVSVVGLTLGAYQGCYLESVRRRHFSVSPGDYSPEVTTTLSCMANCGTFKYMYAAVTSGKFCYCASTLPAAAPVNDTYCDMPCIGDKNQRCGGVKHVSVYTASKKISGLTISTSVENTIIKVADPVTINVSIASGNEVVYRMDYDDGAGQATPNATNMLSMAYYVPGEYSIMVYANNINRTFKDEVAVTTVRVDAPPGETTVSCDPVFATYELGACTLTVWWGSSLQLNVTINTFSYFFGIEDPPLSLAGASVPAKGANPGSSSQQVYVMPAAEFTVSGKVIGWQMYLDTLGTGKLTVLILKPTCSSGTYCYSRNTCSSSCESSTAKVVLCATGQQFCGQASKCYSSCAQTVSRYASLPTSYQIMYKVTVTATSTGYIYVPESTKLQVEPGYILGLQQDSGASVLARISSTADTSDRMFTYSSTTVSQSFVSSGGTVITARHAITAVASAGSKVYLPFRFQTSGNFTLSAVVSSRTLTNVATSSALTSVLVLDGVNASIIQAPVYTATRKVVVFLLDPHTGSDLYYNWTISDGTKFLQTRNSSLSYTFNSSGIYDVNVTIYNSISQKSNGTTVYALDEVTGVFMYSNTTVRGLMTPVLVNVASGTNYTCTYDYGDNTGRQNSGLLSGPMANATKSYTYATPGVYTINITCSNQVSRGTHVLQVKVQDLISNLQLLTLGANTNQNFFIIWQVDAGTALNFALTLNGIALTNFSQVSAYKWQTSLQPGRGNMVLPLVLRAWNDVSTQQISTNFTILTAIANPTFTTNVANASSYDDVYFVANISAGSDVTVTVDYGDGYNDTYTQPLNTNWPGAQTFVHKYFNGGRFTVRATFRNAGGSQTRSVEMLVLVGVGMINCNLDEYALYHPPALVNLMFTSPALPTEPTLTINWGEMTSRDTQPALEMNKNYSYQYRDTGTYKVMARLQNIMGTKTCLKPVTVVEKLSGPFFLPQFPAAALDLPYEVVFCLFRGPTGDLCNMTFDFGDGKGPLVIQRTGNGKNQCDARNVTYNSKGSRTIKVTATSPLETVSLSYTVDVIRGIKDPYVSVTTGGDVVFGNPTTFTLTYSDTTLPDNANFTLDFGDNSTTDVGPYFLTSSTLTVRHTYVKDGLLTATAVLSNAASRAVRQLMVGVYREFQNLQAQAYYLAEIPPNETVFGFNNGSRLYPQNVPTYFIVTDDNNAYASHYNVTITDSTSKSTNYQKFSSVFDITFPKMDTFRVSITAYNPMFSASITPMTLILVELIENFTVVEYNLKARANEYKYFNVSFNKIGSGTCLYVDYNDGVKEIYANDLTVCTDSSFSSVAEADKHAMTELLKPRSGVLNHTYGSDGEYVFTALAKNSQSEVKLTITFSISGFDCARPTVNIHNRRPYFTAPEVYKRSQKLTVRGLTNIQCVASLANVKSWRVERIDERWSTVIENISLANLDTTKAEVTFPPRFFDLGLYRVYYTMEMTGAGAPGGSAYSSTTFTHIKITKTDLIGIMVAGGVSEIQRGTAQRLDLNPTDYSLDPDVSPNVTQGLTVTGWVCENLDSPTDSTSYLAGGFNVTGQNQSLDISKFQLSRYRITVYLAKDTRKTSAILYLKVVEGDPPTATISPATGSVYYQIADGYKVLQSSRVALDCSCDNCGQSESYRWTVYMADYRWPSGWRPLLDDDLYGRVAALDGGNSKQISIESSLFETFKAERMRAECNITSGSTSGKVATNLQINKPPIPGSCTVSPYNRTITTEQAWTINVTGWYDDDGIQEYQFFVHTDDSTVDKQITSYKTDKGSLVLSVRIPEGPDYLNYTQSVIVKVRDNLAATKDFNCGNIVVTPMPQSDIRALAQEIASTQLGEINKMFAEGDQKTCTERATSIMSLLNSDSKRSAAGNVNSPVNFANTMYGESDSNRVYYQQTNESLQEQKEFVYQVESERNDRAAVRGMIINQMANLAVKDIVSVMEMSSTYAEATKYGDEIDQASQKNVMDSLQSMSDFINDPDSIDNVPSEEIESAMRYIVATTACIMDAAGSNGKFGLQSELAKAKEDPTWKDYDTSISALEDEDAPDLSSATSFDEALQMQSARVHKIRQAKTAEQVRQLATETMDKQMQSFSRYSVPGQSFEINSLKINALMEKSDIANIPGKELNVPGSKGGVVLPNTTFLNGSSSEPIGVSVSQSTNFPLRYSKTAEGISSNTNFVSINLFGANSSKLSVKDLVEPVKVVIPRDPKTSEPSYLTVNPMIPSWATVMNFVTNINRSHSSFHMDFQDMDGRQFLLVVKLGGLASIGNSTEFDKCDMVFLMPPNMTDKTDKNRFRFQLDNTVLGNFTGKLAIGIRELNDTEFDLDLSEGCLSLPRFENGTDSFRGLFSMRQYVTQCLAISDDEDDWSANGCVVGRETDVSKTVCYCTHLTTFAGGWVVVPNTIDWSYVFAHADFLSNPTIYITIILTGVLYLVGAIWARHRDKKISETLGIAPLADNDPKDRYFYEIIVSTGFRRNAGTDSQVCFVLSGEDDESDARVFTDSKRKIFRRGQLDGFLMSVPRPLGYLNFMRIWHDNSGRGKFASWYLNYIIVRDVQTDVKQVFIANRWFAVEEDDGQIDRVIPAASREQLGDFSYQFGERSRKNLVDGHLWFSVVARPPQSRFTCLQRVSCCLCLLYVSMLANAMFYRTTTSGTGETSSSSFSFGPFSIAPEQIFIGVVSNLIVFPVNFLLIYLFRKARPHHKRPSRIDLAIKEVIENNKQASINDVKPEVSSIFSVSKTPTLPKDPYATDSRPPTGMSYASTEQLTPKKKKKFELPWYFTIIAWILLWIVTLGSVVMVIFYGISFKDETCRKWITSLLVSFFTSVFITQPIKVFLFAMVLSLIFKNPSNEEEDEDDDEEQPQVDPDSELLHSDVVAATRPRKIGYKPPDPQMLERLRATRMKEIQMWAIIREVIIYSFFLWILMVISYRQLGAGNFLYKNNMKRVFIENLESDIDFYGLKNAKDFWDWTRSGLVNGLRAGPYSNGYPPLLLRAYINDKVSRILGYATIRQLRVKKNQCKVPDAVRGIIRECNVMYDMLDQEENSYTPGWGKALGRGATNTAEEYIYRDSSELNGYPYWGVLSMYSGGGYVAALNGSKADLVETFNRLEAERWIDRYTRAVFVEFTVYNPQVNLFAISTILAEFDPSGGIVQTYRFEPAMLLPYMSSAMLFQLACEVIYLIFTLFFIIREGRELYKSRLTYFTSFWNLVEVGIIAMSLAAIVIYFYRLFVTNDLTSSFKSTKGNGYIKFQYVGYWNEMFSYMIGFLVFFATLKFLKLLRFNRKISMLSSILQHSAKGLLHFGLIFTIVFMAFTQLFYLTFMHIDIGYASFISAVVTTVLMMMGKFDIYSMIMTEPYLSQIFVLLYVIVVSFIIVNIFVSILNETFSAVREDVSKQGNEFEIVDFMLQRFKKWTGIGGSADQSEASPEQNGETNETKGEKSRDHIDDFPDRIEKLLKSISHVYNDQENYAMFYQKKPYAAPPLPSSSPAPPPQSSAPAGHMGVFRNNRSISPAPQARRRDSVIARVQTD